MIWIIFIILFIEFISCFSSIDGHIVETKTHFYSRRVFYSLLSGLFLISRKMNLYCPFWKMSEYKKKERFILLSMTTSDIECNWINEIYYYDG